jgi:hypothetical protein
LEPWRCVKRLKEDVAFADTYRLIQVAQSGAMEPTWILEDIDTYRYRVDGQRDSKEIPAAEGLREFAAPTRSSPCVHHVIFGN